MAGWTAFKEKAEQQLFQIRIHQSKCVASLEQDNGKEAIYLRIVMGRKEKSKKCSYKKSKQFSVIGKKCRNVSQKLNKCGHRLKQLQSVYADLSAICKMEGAGGERRDPGGDGAQILVTVADSSLPSISSVFVIPW